MSSTTKLLQNSYFERIYLKYVFVSKPAESLVRDTNQSGTVEVRLLLVSFSSPEPSVSFGHVVGETEGSGRSHYRVSEIF